MECRSTRSGRRSARLGAGDSLDTAAPFAAFLHHPVQARRFGEEALTLYRASGEDQAAAEVLRWLGHAHVLAGDLEGARTLHVEVLSLREQLGDPVGLARAVRSVTEDELDMGNPTQATELLQRSLELARTAQADYDVAMTLHSLGDVALLRGDGAAATAYYIGSLRPTTEAADRIYCLAGLAAVAALELRVLRGCRRCGRFARS